MKRKDLKKLIQKEILNVQEDLLVDPSDVPVDFRKLSNKHNLDYHDLEDVCPSCGMSPCHCDTMSSNPYSLSCKKCGDVVVMQEGCSCEGGTSLWKPLDIMSNKGHEGAYMAKSQLHKIEEYARKLQEMIPEGYDLDDWMRSHISQAADDIAEVYHKLEYQSHSDY
jgi:hypothetical protein